MYLTLKALHIIAMVCWFAGLFYLPRIFVYYVEKAESTETKAVLQTMAYKLLHYITTPAAVVTALFGALMLIQNPYLFESGWMHIKLTLVVLLAVFHVRVARYTRLMQTDNLNKSGKFFRLFNEIPTFFLLVIVLLAVLKPF